MIKCLHGVCIVSRGKRLVCRYFCECFVGLLVVGVGLVCVVIVVLL